MKILNRTKAVKAGFSLIELSVVILILSIVASAALNVIGKKTQAEKSSVTYTRLEKIGKALKVYAQENNRLPCPMGTGMTLISDNFGEESADDLEAPTDCNSVLESGENAMGFVPVLTLGLPPEYMYDEWGRLITYIMSKNLLSNMDDSSNIPNIDIKNIDSDDEEVTQMWRYAKPTEVSVGITDCRNPSVIITPTSTGDLIPVCAAFVLISHGSNGHGTRSFAGTELTSSIAGHFEELNTPVEIANIGEVWANIYNMPQNISTSTDNDFDESLYFDDILYFMSRESALNDSSSSGGSSSSSTSSGSGSTSSSTSSSSTSSGGCTSSGATSYSDVGGFCDNDCALCNDPAVCQSSACCYNSRGATCSSDPECCSGMFCGGGVCNFNSCVNEGEICVADNDCCWPATCYEHPEKGMGCWN